MSAQLAGDTGNSFHARLALAAGVTVAINAPSMQALSSVVALLQQPAANEAPAAAPRGQAQAHAAADHIPGEKNRDGDPKAQPQGNAPASTATPASAPAAAAGSGATGGEEKRWTYDDVSKRVTDMAKKLGRDAALATLKEFTGINGQPVDHGTKLKLEDYAAFIAKADGKLGAKS